MSSQRPARFGRSLRNWTRYFAYGLVVDADEAIPGLVPQPDSRHPDITLYLTAEPDWLRDALDGIHFPWMGTNSSASTGESSRAIWSVSDGAYIHIRFDDATEFIINTLASEIWAKWDPPFGISDVAVYFLGPILGFFLSLRGVTVLHASAISIDDKAIAFLGPPGSGKSTTAAAFALRGIPVLSEDVTALLVSGLSISVRPGYPSVRLWPASVEMLFQSREALPLLTPGWEKRHLQLGGPKYPFAAEPKVLSAIYYLAERTGPLFPTRVRALSTADALMTLVGNTYANLLLDKRMRASEFRTLSRIATTIPVRHLTSNSDPTRVHELCDVIVEDFQSLSHHTAEFSSS